MAKKADQQLGIADVMELLGVSRATLLRTRQRDESFPIPTWERGQARWTRAEIEQWQRSKKPQRARFRPRKAEVKK